MMFLFVVPGRLRTFAHGLNDYTYAIQKYLILGRRRSPFFVFLYCWLTFALSILGRTLLTPFRYAQSREQGDCLLHFYLDSIKKLACASLGGRLGQILGLFPRVFVFPTSRLYSIIFARKSQKVTEMFRLLLLACALRVPSCTSALGVADSESYATR